MVRDAIKGRRLQSWKGAGMALAMALIAAGCAGASGGPQREQPGAQSAAPRRITAAILTDLYSLGPQGGPVPGKGPVEGLLHAGLAVLDERGVVRPQLAEDVPSVETGLWKVFSDGRMETTWRIRPGARWHDGVPFTADDVLFTARVQQDRELPAFRSLAYEFVDSVEAPDSRTIVVKWAKPYIDADRLFDFPQPKHLLEKPFNDGKATYTDLPYWSDEFIGTGPFKLREWVRSSHISLVANDDYVLGRPKIDEIQVKLIPDPNTMLANILAGSVQLLLGRGISLEQALQVREQWREGRVEINFNNWILIFPQFLYTDPPVVRDVRFRRAMLHAIDRQQMVDTLQAGLSAVAHSILNPNQPQFRDIETNLPRYDYDPRIAAQMLEGLGYTRGSDGVFRDGLTQPLSIEIRTVPTDINLKSFLAVVDYWKQLGVAVNPVVIPTAQQRLLDYRATFPAFELLRNTDDLRALGNFHSSKQRTAASNWSGSYTGYSNPEYDALFERYSTTIPMPERGQIIGQLIYHIADQLVVMGLFYDTLPAIISHRIASFVASAAEGSDQVWSAHLWDLR